MQPAKEASNYSGLTAVQMYAFGAAQPLSIVSVSEREVRGVERDWSKSMFCIVIGLSPCR